MTRTDTDRRSGFAGTKFLELLVPVLSFGGTFAGIFIWSLGFHFGIQYAAIGCVLGSCILVYLAWIRQKKDIVSLTTPIYAFIFFVVPTDYLPGIVLQLLFAASLTILLVRLKYRFGSSDEPSRTGRSLPDPSVPMRNGCRAPLPRCRRKLHSVREKCSSGLPGEITRTPPVRQTWQYGTWNLPVTQSFSSAPFP